MLELDKWTFVLVFINMLVLYWLLRKLLFKPVTEFMEKRSQSIEKSIQDAENAKNEAIALKESYESKLKEARVTADNIISEAKERAQKEYDRILSEAKTDAEAVRGKAIQDIEIERQQMLKEVKNEVASLALAAATKVVEANMDNEANRQLVDKFLKEEGVA